MPDSDVYLKREQEAALNTYRQNREELVNFYKSMGQLGKEKIPKKLLHAEDGRIAQAEALLERKIGEFSKAGANLPPSGEEEAAGRLAIALFLIGRTKKLRSMVQKKDRASLFALYLSLSGQVCAMLEEPYYSGDARAVVDEYSDVEPLLSACSDLCGLIVPPVGEIIAEYRRKLGKK